MCHWINYAHSVSFPGKKKKDNFAIESNRLREHGHILLAFNSDLMQGCQMQTVHGSATGKLTQKAKLFLKNLRKLKRQFEYTIDPGK